MTKLRVVHYLNQFFAGLGAEAHADTSPGRKEGPVGPGMVLQQALGDRAEVVATVYCGDNYANERPGALEEILELVSKGRPDILIAGPAFAAGRYGLACGELCARARAELGITVVSGMHPDNPAVELYRTRVHLVATRENAAGMAEAIKGMARLALKLHAGEPIGSPQEEGYIPTGRRVHVEVKQTAAQRAVDLLVRKVSGQPYTTEWAVPTYGLVDPAPPLKNVSEAKIALVSSGGVVPKGNPDRLESAYATKWIGYSIEGLDDLKPESWQSIHGGFNTTNVNEDPDRMVPLDALRDLERGGGIRELHDQFYSTMGNTSAIPTMRRFAREITQELKTSRVDGIILTGA